MSKGNEVEPACECSEPGFCSRYGIHQTPHAWRICSGKCTNERPCTEAKSQSYRRKWRLDKEMRDGVSSRGNRVEPARAGPVSHVRLDDLRRRLGTLCRHLGEPTGETRECAACVRTQVPLRRCALHVLCTEFLPVKDVKHCRECPDAAPLKERVSSSSSSATTTPLSIARSLVARLDEDCLAPHFPGKRFNSALIERPDGYLLAYRHGWAGSDVYLVHLDRAFKARGDPWKLDLFHPREANYGREDPRLFWFRGRLHVAYVGVVGGHSILHTSMLYARLSKDFMEVEEVYYPRIPGRRSWEKNHSYFEWAGDLYAIYTITPHRILRIDGEHTEWAHETTTPVTWQHGEMRGGASPVRVGDEFWHFFHARTGAKNRLVYNMGVYVFSARPPFEVLRYTPRPVLEADPTTNPGNYASVVFPNGAVPIYPTMEEEPARPATMVDARVCPSCGRRFDDDVPAVPRGSIAATKPLRWFVSMGIHDRWTEIHAFDHDELERAMVSIQR